MQPYRPVVNFPLLAAPGSLPPKLNTPLLMSGVSHINRYGLFQHATFALAPSHVAQ